MLQIRLFPHSQTSPVPTVPVRSWRSGKIKCYLQYKDLLKNAKYTKKKVFDKIAEKFNSISDVVTIDQCLRKWKKLELKQKEIEDNNNKTRREQKKMEDCIGGNPSVKPV